MGRPKKPFPPQPSPHRDQYRVWWNGRWWHLGLTREPEQWRAEYARLIALWSVDPTAGAGRPDEILVSELLADYLESADSPRGKDQRARVTTAAKLLDEMFGHTPAAEFGPVEFRAWQQHLCTLRRPATKNHPERARFNATSVRDLRSVVKAVWKWGASTERVSAERWQQLRAVPPPKHSETRPPREVGAADPAAVEKIIPLLPPVLRAVVALLRASAARPTEILTLRPCDLDRTGAVWTYTPERHKGTWRRRPRVIYFGPAEQQVLLPWLEGVEPSAFVFTPARGEAARSRSVGTRHLQVRYDYKALLRAVQRACDRAGVPRFTSYQLRHLRASEIRASHGLEAARAVLGQSRASMTDQYSRSADAELAKGVVRNPAG